MKGKLDGSLAERVAEILHRYSMAPTGSRIGVAVSGGADSVVLLHLLHRLAPELRLELLVLHVNHQLRGAESDADEEFVRELAHALGVRFLCERRELPPGNLEQEAREARREFFLRMKSEHALDRMALGHTRSDQAETVLLRFLRGCGTAGLGGMRLRTEDGFIRPLLTTGRDEVREWARREGVDWREDSSNQERRFARNRLRLDTMPELAGSFNSNLEGVLSRTAEVAQAEEDYWNSEISKTYGEITKRTGLGSFLQVSALASLHPALQRRLIRRALADLRGDLRSIDVQHIEAILKLCGSVEGHDRAMVPGADAMRSFGTLLITRPGRLSSEERHYRMELQPGEICELPFGGGRLHLDSASSAPVNCATFKGESNGDAAMVEIDGDALTAGDSVRPLYVRNWEPGDAMQRPGHRQAEKLKALFQEYRVLLWERRHWPVVLSGDEIVWARRFGCAAKFQASAASRRTLRLTYSRS